MIEKTRQKSFPSRIYPLCPSGRFFQGLFNIERQEGSNIFNPIFTGAGGNIELLFSILHKKEMTKLEKSYGSRNSYPKWSWWNFYSIWSNCKDTFLTLKFKLVLIQKRIMFPVLFHAETNKRWFLSFILDDAEFRLV